MREVLSSWKQFVAIPLHSICGHIPAVRRRQLAGDTDDGEEQEDADDYEYAAAEPGSQRSASGSILHAIHSGASHDGSVHLWSCHMRYAPISAR